MINAKSYLIWCTYWVLSALAAKAIAPNILFWYVGHCYTCENWPMSQALAWTTGTVLAFLAIPAIASLLVALVRYNEELKEDDS